MKRIFKCTSSVDILGSVDILVFILDLQVHQNP